MKRIFRISVFILLITASFAGCETSPEIDPRSVFVAIYNVTETWTENGNTMTKAPFSMTITPSVLVEDKVLLNNFANYGAGITAEANINGYSLTIPQQTLPNLKAIAGTGKLSDPTLNFTYTEKVNNISVEITAIAKKK